MGASAQLAASLPAAVGSVGRKAACAVRRGLRYKKPNRSERPLAIPRAQGASYASHEVLPKPPGAAAGASASLPAAPSAAPLLPVPVPVALEVPACQLPFGERLLLVGGCQELGQWDVQRGVALQWREGHSWACLVSLPSGQHSFKLVRCRSDGSRVLEWEEGGNRTLRVPELARAAVGLLGAAPVLSVRCRFGDTSATEATADRAQMQAVADAASARVADLLKRKAELAEKLACLEAEVMSSAAKISNAAADAQRALEADLNEQRRRRRQRMERLEEAAAAAEQRADAASLRLGLLEEASERLMANERAMAAADARYATPAVPAALPASLGGLPGLEAVAAAAAAIQTSVVVRAHGDGSVLYSFAPAGACGRQHSAAELAQSRLVERLPAASRAQLERQVRAMHSMHSSSQASVHSNSSGSGVDRELLSSAVSAAGLVVVGAPTPQRMATPGSLVRQEVAAGGRQPGNPSADSELLLSSESGGGGRCSRRGSNSKGSSKGFGGPPKPPQQHRRSRRTVHNGVVTPAAMAAVALTTTPAASRSETDVSQGSITSTTTTTSTTGITTHTSNKQDLAEDPLAPVAGAVVPAVQARSEGAAQLQEQLPTSAPADDITARAIFPAVVAWLAARTVYMAGSLLWKIGREAVPPPARNTAQKVFWLGFAALAATPFL